MLRSAHKLEKKFLTDTAWNYVAFALMALVGVILNFFIAAWFGVEVLGVFNQIYAIFVVMTQLAVLGLNDSVQKHIAELDHDPKEMRYVLAPALTLAAIFGSLVAGSIFALSGLVGLMLDSATVGKGVALAAPGILFFALNKVMMGALSGGRQLRFFAIAQGLRAILILLSCLTVAWFEQPGYVLGSCFTISELVLFPFLVYRVQSNFIYFAPALVFQKWFNTHLRFGSKAMPNGFLSESYIRIDILMLSLFLSDFNIGIYSFAAIFVEGFLQISVVIRTVANPKLIRLLINNNQHEVIEFCRKISRMSVSIFIIICGGVLLVFPFLEPFFPSQLVKLCYPLLLVLTSGLFILSATIPFDQILLQAGYPAYQSVLMTINLMVNVALNLILIPVFGLYGAAIATAIAFVCAAISVNLAARKWLGYRYGLLLH